MDNLLKIRGAKVHNLKNISLDIPRDQLVVITGLSGSGKSSLAFDTIYAEGQRRYVESLSAYARQFIGLMDKPEVDSIEGLSPAISIDQKATSHNPRSTVGTVTEIYDYLRLLYARCGEPHCPDCGQPIKSYSLDELTARLNKDYGGQTIRILAPIIRDKKGEHKSVSISVARAGYNRVRFDGRMMSLEEFEDLDTDKQKKHNLEIVIDTLVVGKGKEESARLAEAVEKSWTLANSLVMVLTEKNKTELLSKDLACPDCGISLPALEPRNFSFNTPHGACPECDGLGTKLEIDPDLILNKKLTIAQGGIRPWSHHNVSGQMWLMRILGSAAADYDFDLNTPLVELTAKQLKFVLYGSDESYKVNLDSQRFSGEMTTKFEGVIPNLERRLKQTDSDYVRKEIEAYMRVLVCPECHGERLKKESLAVRIKDLSIHQIANLSIKENKKFFVELEGSGWLSTKNKKISQPIIKEIKSRLEFLINVGLDYLSLARSAGSLSGGEAQRIRLATQIGASLMGVLYVLDEPSIGLHQRDNDKLIKTLKQLRDLGNTLIVVEHDQAMMEAADYLIDIGPGAGMAGGKVVAQGKPKEVKDNPNSLTGQYLSGKKSIEAPKKYRVGHGKSIKIIGASENNLKKIDVEIPLGKFVAITGVSGSGKSTLMTDILAKALTQKFYHSHESPGKHERIDGLDNLDKVIDIDQSPIGRTPRSNPATYTGCFTPIRDLFASLPEAKLRGYQAGRFSFNVPGGRCEACSGDGLIQIEMQFLPDVYVDCDVCQGRRYNKEVLEVRYKDKNIADVLDMTVEEATPFFKNIPAVHQKLATLNEVGLGYIRLGQSATTLSGGEAQRIKLATELSRRATGKTLYILDEPTTGLHFDDIKRLLDVLQKLVDKGNTILIIEHNLDVIKSVDWIIDLGPEGGDEGGEIVAQGTPKEVAKCKRGYTGEYLAKLI